MVDTPRKPTLEATPEQGQKFLDHLVSKYGPGTDASPFKQHRFLLQVARMQDEAAADAPKRSR